MNRKYSLTRGIRGRREGTAVYQGKFLRLEVPNPEQKQVSKETSKRGLAGFSPASRRRLLQTLSRVSPDALPVFLTLTYGREWPRDPREWKRHLDVFTKRMTREGFAGVWKMEPQRRGAPHFHLLVWGGRVPKEWLASAWAECSGDTSLDHIRAGTRVESIRTSNGVMFYCAKYVGKLTALDDLEEYPEWLSAGRWWGVFNSAAMPWATKTARPLSAAAVQVVQSVIDSVHLCRNKGKPFPDHIRPKSCFIEADEFRLCVEHRARLYAESQGLSAPQLEALIAEIFL